VPATLVSPTTLTYRDPDGDTVSVVFSRPLLTPAAAGGIFRFDTGSIDGSNVGPQALLDIDFGGLGAEARGIDIMLTAKSNGSGSNGTADVGTLWAVGVDLGDVVIDGDLGRVRTGDAVPATPGIRSLTVATLGASAPGDRQLDEFRSEVVGRVGRVEVRGNVGGELVVTGGPTAALGELIVGGDYDGNLSVEGRLGAATVRGDVHGEWGAAGGAGAVRILGSLDPLSGDYQAGRVSFEKKVDLVYVGHDLVGGPGVGTGNINVGTAGDVIVNGSVLGGAGNFSGWVDYHRILGGLTVNGSLVGGGGFDSGYVSGLDAVGSIRVSGSIRGGIGEESGRIVTQGRTGTVEVLGDVAGGVGERSGSVAVVGRSSGVRSGAASSAGPRQTPAK
jgi:hypothetical protein